MNFQTILEELDRLYEADQQIKAQEKAMLEKNYY